MSLAGALSTQLDLNRLLRSISPEVSIHRERLWVPEPLIYWGSSGKNVHQNWKLSQGRAKMKNRPYSGPKTEAKLHVFSVYCPRLPIQKMNQEEPSRVGCKTGVGGYLT